MSFELPSSLRSLSDYIIRKWTRLNQILIPPSVVSIGNNSFNECKLLTQLSIPSVILIGEEAFIMCKSLHEIILSPYLNEIKARTFSECTSLEKIEIPFYVLSIGPRAFSKC